MKKFISVFVATTLLLMNINLAVLADSDFIFTYIINGDEATITGVSEIPSDATEIVVPSFVSDGTDEYKVEFVEMEFGNTYKIDDIEVTPLRGMHNTYYEKNSSNYLIRLKDGRLMYYALDSGYYLEETFEFLKKVKLDILISECTFPNERPRDTKGCPVHMDITSCIDTLDRLYENGTIDSTTDIYLTHIGEKGKTHKELETYFNNIDRDYNVNIAYDGLSIDE